MNDHETTILIFFPSKCFAKWLFTIEKGNKKPSMKLPGRFVLANQYVTL